MLPALSLGACLESVWCPWQGSSTQQDSPPRQPLPLNHQSCHNLSVTGIHHGDATCPALLESRMSCANQTAKHEGQCRFLLHPNLALLKIDSKNLGQTPPRTLVKFARELLRSFIPHILEQEVRSFFGNASEETILTARLGRLGFG